MFCLLCVKHAGESVLLIIGFPKNRVCKLHSSISSRLITAYPMIPWGDAVSSSVQTIDSSAMKNLLYISLLCVGFLFLTGHSGMLYLILTCEEWSLWNRVLYFIWIDCETQFERFDTISIINVRTIRFWTLWHFYIMRQSQ